MQADNVPMFHSGVHAKHRHHKGLVTMLKRHHRGARGGDLPADDAGFVKWQRAYQSVPFGLSSLAMRSRPAFQATQSIIPRIIHQTWKNENIQSVFEGNMASWVVAHPSPPWEYWFWTDDDAEAFISTAYPEFLPIFHGYEGNWAGQVQKADIWRYFVLFHYGGVYADLDVEVVKPLDDLLNDPNRTLILSQEPLAHSVVLNGQPRTVCNAVMLSRPGHPFWEHVFDKIKEKRWSSDPVDSTGPRMLEHAMRDYEKQLAELRERPNDRFVRSLVETGPRLRRQRARLRALDQRFLHERHQAPGEEEFVWVHMKPKQLANTSIRVLDLTGPGDDSDGGGSFDHEGSRAASQTVKTLPSFARPRRRALLSSKTDKKARKKQSKRKKKKKKHSKKTSEQPAATGQATIRATGKPGQKLADELPKVRYSTNHSLTHEEFMSPKNEEQELPRTQYLEEQDTSLRKQESIHLTNGSQEFAAAVIPRDEQRGFLDDEDEAEGDSLRDDAEEEDKEVLGGSWMLSADPLKCVGSAEWFVMVETEWQEQQALLKAEALNQTLAQNVELKRLANLTRTKPPAERQPWDDDDDDVFVDDTPDDQHRDVIDHDQREYEAYDGYDDSDFFEPLEDGQTTSDRPQKKSFSLPPSDMLLANVFVAPPEWFMPFHDVSPVADKCKNNYDRLSEEAQDICTRLARRKYQNQIEPSSYTVHHWSHTWLGAVKDKRFVRVPEVVKTVRHGRVLSRRVCPTNSTQHGNGSSEEAHDRRAAAVECSGLSFSLLGIPYTNKDGSLWSAGPT